MPTSTVRPRALGRLIPWAYADSARVLLPPSRIAVHVLDVPPTQHAPVMRSLLFAVFALMADVAVARPVIIPTIEQLMAQSPVVVVIHPESVRQTTDQPDDTSFGSRDLQHYQALETTCRVVATFKGSVTEQRIKIVHFAYANPKPEFNGGLMMSFLFDPVRFVTFPARPDRQPDLSLSQAYGFGGPEYLAFLRRLPDGRFAAATPHYDAATSFRLLTPVFQAQRYHHHPAAKPAEPPKQ